MQAGTAAASTTSARSPWRGAQGAAAPGTAQLGAVSCTCGRRRAAAGLAPEYQEQVLEGLGQEEALLRVVVHRLRHPHILDARVAGLRL